MSIVAVCCMLMLSYSAARTVGSGVGNRLANDFRSAAHLTCTFEPHHQNPPVTTTA